MIPKDHPRRASLEVRERLVECFKKGIVVEQGLIAHGRGEAFDYLLGERTIPPALNAIKAGVAAILLATNPVISVNGNVACLCSKDMVELANTTNAKLEINLFYKSRERIKAIEEELRRNNAKKIFGVNENDYITIPEISSNRRIVDKNGIYTSDLVLVPLEDGDRTEALIKMNKMVVTIDLNPLSRTSKSAHISIIDNVIRAVPLMIEYAKKYSMSSKEELRAILNNFDNKANLNESLRYILRAMV